MQAISFLDEIIALRRDIHAHPELAFKENRTADLVARELHAYGVTDIRTGIGKTGVVGFIEGQNASSGQTIGLRADMDALPIQETSNLPWASKNDGVMHACGHDGHTAILLGTARHLALTRHFNGRVMVIFQPAEEGYGGARRMMRDGLFSGDLDCTAVFAMHNTPFEPFGHAVIADGIAMASADTFKVIVTGQGGHVGVRNDHNPVLHAASMIVALPALRAHFDGAQGILEVTNTAAGNGAVGKIPETATFTGSLRTFSEDVRGRVKAEMEKTFEQIAHKAGVRVDVTYPNATGTTVNTPAEKALAVDVLRMVFGANVDPQSPPPMFAEDFGDMLRRRPGAYFALGQRTQESGANNKPLHTPGYDFYDPLILPGIKAFTTLVEHAMPLVNAPSRYSLIS